MKISLPQQLFGSDREQLDAMRRYLCQLAGELEFALGDVEKQVLTVDAGVRRTEKTAEALQASTAPKASFAAVKSLIIKSADIVNAYYEEMNRRFGGEYTAQSDFGTFREKTTQEIRENSRELRRLFTDVQEILDAVTRVETSVSKVNAWIRTGRLSETDSAPVYGVEIGQQTELDGVVVFQKFARLLADRLSFFDRNGVEVSFIGDETMHITRAEADSLTAADAAVSRLRLGDYLLTADPDGHLTLT